MRDMIASDLKGVLSIEQAAHISPWSRSAFDESLNAEHICRLCYSGKDIVGFHICSHVLDEIHILNIVVAPDFQGQGCSHVLLHDITDLARENACERVFLEVRESNKKAQFLYKKWGFSQISIRKNYYKVGQNIRENALIFVKQLDI